MSTLDQPSRWLSKARPAAALAAILTTVVVAVTSILAVATTTAAPMLHPQTRVVGIGLSAGKIVGPNETALRGGSRSSVMLVPGPLIVATTRDGAFGSHDYDLATSNAQSRPAQVALTQGGVALRSVRSAPDAHDVSARSASCVAAEGGFATAPDQAVFWSGIKGGDQTAAAWAADNGGTTLEMTPGGSSLPPWDASNPAVATAALTRVFASSARLVSRWRSTPASPRPMPRAAASEEMAASSACLVSSPVAGPR